ncbi:lipopolysaccharide biosynthesis protein [Bradyrhizobium embrapense]
MEEALEAHQGDGPKAGVAVKKGPSHLLGNSAWNATAFAVAVLLNLAILPFVISRLGLAAFGVAGLVTACVAPALMFSNALGLSTTRELAQRLGQSDRSEARRFFATALALAIAVGGLISALLILAGPPLARLGFHLGGPASDDLGLAFALAGVGWLFQCLFAVFLSLFTARQDYRRIASISITGTVVTTMSMLLLIPHAPRASTFLGCQALGFATNFLMASAWSRHVMSDWLARPALDRSARCARS